MYRYDLPKSFKNWTAFFEFAKQYVGEHLTFEYFDSTSINPLATTRTTPRPSEAIKHFTYEMDYIRKRAFREQEQLPILTLSDYDELMSALSRSAYEPNAPLLNKLHAWLNHRAEIEPY